MKITEITVYEYYLLVRGNGHFNPALAIDLFKQVVQASLQHKRPCVLIDFVNVEGNISVLTLYEMGVKVAQLATGISHLALLERPERILPDRFWQNVARNRGLNVLVCSTEREAIDYLSACHQTAPLAAGN
jgi:hypothetical protein